MASESELGAYINGLTAETSPDTTNDMLLMRDATDGGLKKISVAEIAGAASSGLDPSGWQAADALTYASADDPTFTATCSGDQTTKYSVGMRIKLTQSTGGTKYFIITALAYGAPNTTLTLYGGTDYNLENEAISNPYYSPTKAPVGFPADPNKWAVLVSDTTDRNQANPTINVWYNPGSLAIAIPLGVWNVSYLAHVELGKTATTALIAKITLSTANNSESDADFTGCAIAVGAAGGAGADSNRAEAEIYRIKCLVLAAKATYYLNVMSAIASCTNIDVRGDLSKTIIRAVCAYL